MTTGISWCDETWNPVTGCSPISEGCEHCYARAMAKRLYGAGHQAYGEWPREIAIHEDRMGQPSRWRKPRRVFVVSMGDLFHDRVDGATINRVWLEAFNNPRHVYFFLTKRPENLRVWTMRAAHAKGWPIGDIWPEWMWIGVTAENQARADERIPILLNTPAANRFVSVEPMLGPVNLDRHLTSMGRHTTDGRLGWVICGGESGPGHRPMEEVWPRALLYQCQDYGVPFHFKQHSGPRPGYNPLLNGMAHGAMPPFGRNP